MNAEKNSASLSTCARRCVSPKSISDDERAQTLETHRNYFANYLFALMEQKNFTEADIAAKAHVDAAIFDKLRNVKRYIPEERTIWVLIFALELTFDEANNLLHRAKRYLSATVWEEVLIAFFLDDQIYDAALLNEVLNHYELAPLEVTEDFSLPPEKNSPTKVCWSELTFTLRKIFSTYLH